MKSTYEAYVEKIADEQDIRTQELMTDPSLDSADRSRILTELTGSNTFRTDIIGVTQSTVTGSKTIACLMTGMGEVVFVGKLDDKNPFVLDDYQETPQFNILSGKVVEIYSPKYLSPGVTQVPAVMKEKGQVVIRSIANRTLRPHPEVHRRIKSNTSPLAARILNQYYLLYEAVAIIGINAPSFEDNEVIPVNFDKFNLFKGLGRDTLRKLIVDNEHA
jgi:hypothetical protein